MWTSSSIGASTDEHRTGLCLRFPRATLAACPSVQRHRVQLRAPQGARSATEETVSCNVLVRQHTARHLAHPQSLADDLDFLHTTGRAAVARLKLTWGRRLPAKRWYDARLGKQETKTTSVSAPELARIGRTGKLNVPNHGPIIHAIRSVQSSPSSAPTTVATNMRKMRASGRSALRTTTQAVPMTGPNGRLQSAKASRSPFPNPSCNTTQHPASMSEAVTTVAVAPATT